MVRRGAGYLAVAAAAVYLFFMYNEPVLSGILIFLLAYPLVSALYLAAVGRKLAADMSRIPSMGEEGRRIRGGIVMRNLTRRAFLRYEAEISVGNSFSRKRRKRRFRGTAAARTEETLWFEFDTESCGNIEVRLEWVRVYDFLGIFYWKRKAGQKACVKVMPHFDLMPLEITKKTRDFQAEAEEYSDERKGDDPSEIYQVREYRMEDPLRDIHWKLSAKEDQLMVKERAFPLGCAVLVWIDLPEKGCSGENFARLLRTAASLSITLAQEKCIHLTAWYEEKNSRVAKWRVQDAESAYGLIWRLMDLEPYKDEQKKEICRREAFLGWNFSSIVTIDGEGVIRKDGAVQEMLRL